MPRKLFLNNTVYEQVSPKAHSEAEFTNALLTKRFELFPEFHVCRFEVLVEAPYVNKKPDLAIIDKKYTNWWVVEVELNHHPLKNHVLPQVSAFAEGNYNQKHADYIMRFCS